MLPPDTNFFQLSGIIRVKWGNISMKSIYYSDNQLIEMIKRGGSFRERAFIFLLKKEAKEKNLHRLLNKKGVRPEEIEEIVNETMVALNTSISKGNFKPGSSIQAYLTGAAKNIWNKMWAKQSRLGKSVSIDTLYFPDNELNAEARVIQKEERAKLFGFFDRLSEACQRILKLAYFKEYSNEELVKILGYKDKSVVSSKKSKCLRKLIEIIRNSKI